MQQHFFSFESSKLQQKLQDAVNDRLGISVASDTA
jgi:hypothetical protein